MYIVHKYLFINRNSNAKKLFHALKHIHRVNLRIFHLEFIFPAIKNHALRSKLSRTTN